MEYLNYYKDKKNQIYLGNIFLVETNFFPFLKGDTIKPDYYNDIFHYLYIIEVLEKFHKADNHRGINSLRNYIT